jgi:hypothetical protein
MKDFLINYTNQTLFKNGDISTGESDNQHKRHLLVCAKGSFKEFPSATVGAMDFLESEDEAGFLREVRTKYTEDGMTVNEISTEDGKLKVDAKY